MANEPIHDVLRGILRRADEPLTMDEVEERLYDRLQAGIRGLNFTGELNKSDELSKVRNRVYDLNEGGLDE